MEMDDAQELAFSTAHQAYAASSELPMPKTFKQAMAGTEKAHGRRHTSKRLLRTWRMVLGDLLSSLMAAHLLDRAGYSTSSTLQMGPSSATRRGWLPKGFPSDLGGDYVESFAPTIWLSVVHALFALVAADDLECDSIDITTAFLNGDLEEEIYMKPPEGYEQYSRDGRSLYCLLKVFYGLKQGGRQWYLKLSEVMKQIGFRKVHSEPCVYLWEDSTGGKVVVPTYVDDCHIISKTKESIQHIKTELQRHFKLCDLGPTSWFLIVDIKRNRSTRNYTVPMPIHH